VRDRPGSPGEGGLMTAGGHGEARRRGTIAGSCRELGSPAVLTRSDRSAFTAPPGEVPR